MRAPRGPLRVRGDVLRRADGQRPGGSAARTQPRGWPVALPVGPQCGQQAGASRVERSWRPWPGSTRISLRSLARAVRVSRTTALTRRPGGGIRRTRCLGCLAFVHTRWSASLQDPWERRSPWAWWESEVEDSPAQGLRREELQPCSRLMAGTPRPAPLDEAGVQVRPHLLWM